MWKEYERVLNRIVPLLAATILGLVLGFGLYPFVFPQESPNELFGEDQVDQDSPIAISEPRRQRIPERKERSTSPSVVGDSDVKVLLDSVDLGDKPVGNGSFWGTVKTKSGRPVKGVTVTAQADLDAMPGSEMRRLNRRRGRIEDDIRSMLEVIKWRDMTSVVATTDANGVFSLDGLAKLPYQLSAHHPNYRVSGGFGNSRTSLPNRKATFTATWSPEVEFSVKLPNGELAEFATVNLRRGKRSSDWERKWSREAKSISITEGRWIIDANTVGDKSRRSEAVEVLIEEGDFPEPIELIIVQQPGFRGKIMMPPNIAASPELYLLKNVKVEDVTRSVLRKVEDERQFYKRLRSDVEPTFSFVGLEPGPYLFCVTFGQERLVAAHEITIGDSMLERDIECNLWEGKNRIVVRVEDSQGKLVADAWVRVSFANSRYIGPGGSAVKRSDGTHSIQCIRPESENGTSDGHFKINASARGFGEKSVEIDPVKTRGLTIRLEEPGVVNLTVLGIPSAEVRRKLKVSILRRRSAHSYEGIFDGTLDQDGCIEMSPLQSEELILKIQNGPRYASDIVAMPINVRPGKQSMTINFPKLHRLKVQVGKDQKAGGLWLMSKMEDLHWHQRINDLSSGEVTFEHVPAGTFELTYSVAGERKNLKVTIPSMSRISLE